MNETYTMICSRCGGNVWEMIDDRQSRCVDCGLGATRGVLSASSPAEPLDDATRRERQAMMDAHRRQSEQRFIDAPFRPYTLDGRWSGRRSLGGSGASNGRVNRLRLAHVDGAADVRVETTSNPEIAYDHRRWYAARDLIFDFWVDTEPLPADVRRAVFAAQPGEDPTAPWAKATTTVDGVSFPFAVLSQGDRWAGLVVTPDLDVEITVTSQGWPIDRTGLVRVDDLTPYTADA